MHEFDINNRLPVPVELRQQIFRGSDAVAAGLISETRLRREYRRVLHGVYVPPETAIDHGVRTLGALLCLPESAVLTAHSSAWWYGVTFAETTAPVVAIVPADFHRAGPRGVKLFRGSLNPVHVSAVDGIRVTTPVRTAWDAAILTAPANALGIVDGLLRRKVMNREQLRQMAADMACTWGISRVRPIFDLANGLSESAAESWTRWLLHQSKIPPAVLQLEIHDGQGRFLARVDFGWPERKVALEYDGAHHADPLQQVKDGQRHLGLTRLGWTVIHMTSNDLRDPSRVLQDLRRALAL